MANEAAERLRVAVMHTLQGAHKLTLLEQALAAERQQGREEGIAIGTRAEAVIRRATVERIGERFAEQVGGLGPDWKLVRRVLDEEAARG